MRISIAKRKKSSRALLGASSAMPAPPPVLKEQGSFFVNGEVMQTENPGGGNPGGRIVVNQMYVEYAIPQKQNPRAWPVIMVHGAGHTGKTYDTTPDGRDGWKQHLLRKGYSVYVVDQVGRARSGWNATPMNYPAPRGGVSVGTI